MILLIEGEEYPLVRLQEIFEDKKFYTSNNQYGRIDYVGYYYSYKDTYKKVVLMLPKVFIDENNTNNTIFRNEDSQPISKEELVDLLDKVKNKHTSSLKWVNHLSLYFYNSIVKYKSKFDKSRIVKSDKNFELNTNLGQDEYSYLDLVLSFVALYKKNKDLILFKYIEATTQKIQKVKWEKTIRKSLPIISKKGKPIYTQITNRKKIVDNEEELLIYFFSILYHIDVKNIYDIHISSDVKIIKGAKFDSLLSSGLGLRRIRKIKYKYFNDILKRIYSLCELFFTLHNTSSLKKPKEDFICVSNYNIIFEDMVDELLSDTSYSTIRDDSEMSIKSLKNNPDGKIIDHIYSQQSLLDPKDIFFIGDSKYYKHTTALGKVARYKQFTYAKNIIQVNLDLLHDETPIENVVYRDELTEGYNITPNFMLYGYIDDEYNYSEAKIQLRTEQNGESVFHSYHFADRLFDRDSLFLQQYYINFLYVLKSYTLLSITDRQMFRKDTREQFRSNLISYFNSSDCPFQVYLVKHQLSVEDLGRLIDDNFRVLNGKVFQASNRDLFLALLKKDKEDALKKMQEIFPANSLLEYKLC